MLNIFSGLRIGHSNGSKWGLVSTNTEASIRYGINTHIGYGTGFSAYNNEAGVIDEIAALGFTAFRDNCLWTAYEASAGVYTCTPTGDTQSQELFAGLARNKTQGYGLHMTFGCLYNNHALYGSTPDATWRGHFVDAMEAFANAYIAADYDPSMLTMELWNEPQVTAAVFEASTEADEFAELLIELYERIKTIDSSISVIGPAHTMASWSGYSAWNSGFFGVPGWSLAMDAFSDHIYDSGESAARRYPERLVFNSRNFYSIGLQSAAVADGSSNLPVIVNECGWNTSAFTDAVITKYYPRMLAILSCIQRLREVTSYELIDANSSYFGLSSSLGVRKTQATAVAAILVHLKLATRRRYYWTGGSYGGGDHAVLLDVSGGQRLVVWTLEGTRNVTLSITAQSAGTLSTEIVGSTTSTQALVPGANSVTVELTDTAKVLYADVAINFPEFA